MYPYIKGFPKFLGLTLNDDFLEITPNNNKRNVIFYIKEYNEMKKYTHRITVTA